LPDVILDGSFEKTAELYEALGGLLDEKAKAEELAEYSRGTFGEMRELLRRAPPDQSRPRLLRPRAQGARDGARGLAQYGDARLSRRGQRRGRPGSQRSGDSVSGADPGLGPRGIITLSEDFYRAIWSDPIRQGVAAVRGKRVYLAPSLPFGWFDLPASVNRLIGEHWLAAVLHPQAARDLRATTAEFYAILSH
jgi:iron complex transport system substrate-binding protein